MYISERLYFEVTIAPSTSSAQLQENSVKILLVVILSIASVTAYAATFQLVPLTLDNGFTVKGTLDTDGTVGYLSPANIVSWNLTVTQTTDVVYTDKAYTPSANEVTTVVVTAPPEVSGVLSNGKRLFVQRSPDTTNYVDGGSFLFRGPGVYEPTWAMVADFTSYTSWYFPDSIMGGVAGWTTAFGMSLGAPLTQAPCRANGSCPSYAAATAVSGQPNVFKLVPVTTQTVAPVQTLFGTVTTDGTLGPLASNNFVAWHVVGRTQDIRSYNQTNSQILNLVGTFTDNSVLRIDNNPNGNLGILEIGVPSRNPSLLGISVKLADFADPAYVGGVASYFYGNFGLQAAKSPLTTRKTYVVGRVK